MTVDLYGVPHMRFHACRKPVDGLAGIHSALNEHARDIKLVHNRLESAGITAAKRVLLDERAVSGADKSAAVAVSVFCIGADVFIDGFYLADNVARLVRLGNDGSYRFVVSIYRLVDISRGLERAVRIIIIRTSCSDKRYVLAVLQSCGQIQLVNVYIEQIGIIHKECVARRAERYGDFYIALEISRDLALFKHAVGDEIVLGNA